MIRSALQIIRDSLLDVWGDLWTTLVCNLIWLLANLLIIPGPPATLALVFYANRLAHGEIADLHDFWSAFKHHWGAAWRWGSINLVVVAFLAGDLILTDQMYEGVWSYYLQGFYIALLAGWALLQFFALPFLFEQETPGVFKALKNGIALIGRNPGFAVALFGLLTLLLVFGIIFFMLSVAFGAVILASASNRAVIDRLKSTGKNVQAGKAGA